MTGSDTQGGNKISRLVFMRLLGGGAIGYFAYRAGFISNLFRNSMVNANAVPSQGYSAIAAESTRSREDGILMTAGAGLVTCASYIIYVDPSDGSVNARNGITGTIDYKTNSAPANSTDTTTLFNNVFTVLQSTGGLVFLTKGSFVINGSINVGKSDGTLPGANIVIVGEGMDNTIVQFDADAFTPGDAMFHARCNATFEKFTVDGNGKSSGLILCDSASYLITEGMHFLNNSARLDLQTFATHTKPAQGCLGQITRDCWFDKTSIGDQCAVGVVDFAIIEGNYFDKRQAGAGTNGSLKGSTLTAGSGSEIIICNNVFYCVPSNDWPGLSIEPWGSTYNSVLIDGNILVDCRISIGGIGDWTQEPGGENTLFKKIVIANNILQGHSIWVNGPSTTPKTTTGNITNVLIANNQISNSYWMGILVAHITGPTTITNNIIKDSNFIQTDPAFNGLIYVETSDQMDIINNICQMTVSTKSKSPFGIKYNSCSNLRVFGNKIINNTANPSIDDSELAAGPNINITMWDNQGYVTNAEGASIHDGTGSATTFTISHGLDTIPTIVTHSTNQDIHSYISSITSTNFTVTFLSAPEAGTGNVSIYWRASKRTFA
jgi:hypothetical protein